MKCYYSLALISLWSASASAFAPRPSKSSPPSTSQLANDLWNSNDDEGKGKTKDMSKALPFVPRPKILDGSLPADAGFE
jgi:hypothetical protein